MHPAHRALASHARGKGIDAPVLQQIIGHASNVMDRVDTILTLRCSRSQEAAAEAKTEAARALSEAQAKALSDAEEALVRDWGKTLPFACTGAHVVHTPTCPQAHEGTIRERSQANATRMHAHDHVAASACCLTVLCGRQVAEAKAKKDAGDATRRSNLGGSCIRVVHSAA